MPSISLKKRLGFMACLLLMGTLFHYPVTMDEPIYGIHQWRQGDCFSITQNYYHEDRSFFDPRINNISDGEEDGLSEFPIIYYLNAQLMKLTGPTVVIPRLSSVLLVLTGLYFLFLALRRVLKDDFLGAIIPLFIFCSPILIYYGQTPMLNVPALGVLFISIYFFVRFYEKGSWPLLLYASLFLSLAGLMRTTMSIGGAPFYVLFVLELFGMRYGREGERLFGRPLIHGLMLSIPVLSVGSWFGYAKYFNTVEGNSYFLMDTRSIFGMDSEGIWRVAVRLFHEHFQELFTLPVFLMLFLMFLNVLLFRRIFEKRLFIFTASYAVVTSLFFLLWYENLFEHDYYLFELFPFCISILVTFSYFMKTRYPEVLSSRSFRFTAILLLIIGIYNGFVLQGKRYDISGTLMGQTFLLSRSEASFWGYFHHKNLNVSDLNEVTPYLRSLGIDRDDPVISLPDPTPNHTLSLMDQKGFTQLFAGEREGKRLIEHWMEQGAQYLVISDLGYLDENDLSPYTDRLLGKYENIRIFELPKEGAEKGSE